MFGCVGNDFLLHHYFEARVPLRDVNRGLEELLHNGPGLGPRFPLGAGHEVEIQGVRLDPAEVGHGVQLVRVLQGLGKVRKLIPVELETGDSGGEYGAVEGDDEPGTPAMRAQVS